MTDELIVCRQSVLAKAIQDAVAPIIADRYVVASLCQQALDLAHNRTDVIAVVRDENVQLRSALMRLLDSSEFAKHSCGDGPDACPVAFARSVLRGPVRQ